METSNDEKDTMRITVVNIDEKELFIGTKVKSKINDRIFTIVSDEKKIS